ncbi:MAG TPA: ribulokinase [Acidimicrobiales bacterium]|nr:ribulokinase [Acidimicrobiales bacterium]
MAGDLRAAERLALGVDFGTESGRVLVLDLASGAELATSEVRYPHGVIEAELETGERLATDWALQDPSDYLEVLRRGVPAALAQAGVSGAAVVGIGVDFTSCTVLPTTADGTPLSMLEQWRRRPHAWTKLWKHHAAQRHADRLNEVALERGEPFLARYGGRISSEWYFPKLIQLWEEDREVYDAASAFIEATDWIVWQLCGAQVRAACPAGYKAFWSAREGLPSSAYFDAAFPGFADPAAKLGTGFAAPGTRAGTLVPALAADLGLHPGVAVAVGNVDSFVSVPGAGVERPGVFVMVIGTSICDMVVDPDEVRMPGITGVVEDGILAGLFGYEAGQPAVGDMFAWYVDRLIAPGEAPGQRQRRFEELEAAAATVPPGASGLVALDWWNGNRSVLADADLSGVLAGLSLSTTREQIYRAMFEAVAFGTRRIVDNFTEHGLALGEIVACGGIAEKSPLLMQLIADATGLEVSIPDATQIPARGAALFGAVAAGGAAGGFDDLSSAVAALRPSASSHYRPDPATSAALAPAYGIYRSLHDLLGRDRVDVLHDLKQLRRGAGLSGAT